MAQFPSSSGGETTVLTSPKVSRNSFKPLPVKQERQMSHFGDARLQHLCCFYLPTPQSRCSTAPRRRRLEANKKSPRCLTLLKSAWQPLVFSRGDKAAQQTKADAAHVSPARTDRRSNSPVCERRACETPAHQSQRTSSELSCFQRKDSGSCRSGQGRGFTGESAFSAEEAAASRAATVDGSVLLAAAHSHTTSEDFAHVLKSTILEKSTQRRRRQECGGRLNAGRRAVTDSGGMHIDEKVKTNQRCLHDQSYGTTIRPGTHSLNCTTSHPTYESGNTEVLECRIFPHPAPTRGQPNTASQEQLAPVNVGKAAPTRVVEKDAPKALIEETCTSASGSKWHAYGLESPTRSGSESSPLDPETSTNKEDSLPNFDFRSRVHYAFASSAVHGSRDGVAALQSAQRPLEIEDTFPQGCVGRAFRKACDRPDADGFLERWTGGNLAESQERPQNDTTNLQQRTLTRCLKTDSKNSSPVLLKPSEFAPVETVNQAEKLHNKTESQSLTRNAVAEPTDNIQSPLKVKRSDARPLSMTQNAIVTHEHIVTLLERCSAISIYGADVENSDPSSSPFHSAHRPSISLRDYYLNRIVKYSQMSPTDLVLAMIYINKLLKASSPLLLTKHAVAKGPLELRPASGCSNADTKCRHTYCSSAQKLVNEKVDNEATPSPTWTSATAFNAHEAVEFNVLTAHRLLLTASLLANKVHYDRHLMLKHWAKLGGLEKGEVVTLEAAFLRIIDWRVQVSVEDFLRTCKRIALGDVSLLLKSPTQSGGRTTPLYLTAVEVDAPGTKPRKQRDTAKTTLPNGSLRHTSACDEKVSLTHSIQEVVDRRTSSSGAALYRRQFPGVLLGPKNIAWRKEFSFTRLLNRIPHDNLRAGSAEGTHAQKARIHQRTRETCKASNDARATPSNSGAKLTLTETQRNSATRQELEQLNSPTLEETAKPFTSLDRTLGGQRASAFGSQDYGSLKACTNSCMDVNDGAHVGNVLQAGPRTSSQYQCVPDLGGLSLSSITAALALVPQIKNPPASGVSVSKKAAQRTRNLVRTQNMSAQGARLPPLQREDFHRSTGDQGDGIDTVSASPTRYRENVLSCEVLSGTSQPALQRVPAQGSPKSVGGRDPRKLNFEETFGLRRGTYTTCGMNKLNTVSNSSGGEMTADGSLPETSSSLNQELAYRLLLTTSKQEAASPESCAGKQCGNNRREPPTTYFGGAHETRRNACSALATRTTAGYSVEEWKTTTATTVEGISHTEELGTCHSPRSALKKCPHEQRTQATQLRLFATRAPCSRIPAQEEKTNQRQHTSRAGPVTAAEKPLSKRLPANLKTGVVLPVW